MFTLRTQHTEAFNQDIRHRFEERMVVHLNEFFPAQCQRMGEPEVRKWINTGIDKAGSYGIVAERDVCKYIDIMFVHGREFDTDPKKAWARPILTAKSVDSADKTKALFQAARKHAGDWNA